MSEVVAKKSLGQHWLRDDSSLDAMLKAAEVSSGDNVLEIGPGTGNLTVKLVDKGAKITAVELDSVLAKLMQNKFRGVRVVEESILNFDFGSMPEGYKIVANIPYYLTAHLLRNITETNNKPEIAALLVQKEVAERVVAGPGQMSTLSVALQMYFAPSLGPVVPAKMFDPAPKVDSQILILKNRNKVLFETDDKLFFRLVKAGFSEKRKKLRSSLSGGLQISKPEAEVLCAAAGIDPHLRAQALSLEQWHQLYKAFIK